MKNRIFIILLLSAVSIIAEAQQTKLLTAEKHNEYGLVYSLPITSFQIEVTAVKETAIAGPYSKYAKVFLSESDVISENYVKWSLESVKVTTFGVPDLEERYLMQLKAGATTYIAVDENGMLLAINKEVSNPSLTPVNKEEILGETATGKEYLEFMNEDFVSAQSSYKKAQLIAEELEEIRDAKLSLTRGTAETMPTDGRQLEIMLASLEKQEQALTQAFKGSLWKEKFTRTFTVTPDDEGNFIICKLDPDEGFMNRESKKGSPVTLTVKMLEEAQLPVDAKGEEKKIPKDAVVYCIPGTANININFMGKSLFKQDCMMSQFGMVFGLNPGIFTDKKEPSFAVFDPATGSLLELGTIKP